MTKKPAWQLDREIAEALVAAKSHTANRQSVVAGGVVSMKTCKRCGASEWPCFLVVELCRMCQARRRDEQRALEEMKP